jgi:DNA modification methylase
MKESKMNEDLKILVGDCRETLKQLPDQCVQTCITSPPYFGLRDYGNDGQIGLEQTPHDFVDQLVSVFREVKRVLRDDGTLWLNLGDSYSSYKDGKATPDTTRGEDTGTLVDKGLAKNRMASTFTGTRIKNKDLIGIPWMVAFALRSDGWYLRQDIIWHKPNPMPESVEDRCTKSHEYIFLMSKSQKYYYDQEAIKVPPAESTPGRGPVDFGGEKGRNYTPDKNDPNFRGGNEQWGRTYEYKDGNVNKKSVWTIPTKPFKGAHFATFPEELIQPCILAGSKAGDVVLDPFGGSGTTGKVAIDYGRKAILCELNPDYVKIINERTNVTRGFQF